jgi:signal transduction histidine kinase/DNA-binding response OmpR family regulator
LYYLWLLGVLNLFLKEFPYPFPKRGDESPNQYAVMNSFWGNSSNTPTSFFDDNNDQDFFEKYHILLIEDNPGDARLVQILLEESDFAECEFTHCICLEDGLAALEAKPNHYDVVLSDLTLPDSRGLVTLETLLSRFPNINAIVMTGLDDQSIGLRAVKIGAQDFLVKGNLDSEILAKSLRYSIERSNALKRLEEAQHVAKIGNWEYNTKTHEITVSDEVYRIAGLPSGSRKSDFKSWEGRSVLFEDFEQIFKDTVLHTSIKKDLRINYNDGTSKAFFVQSSISKQHKDMFVLSGILQDVTERKQTELLKKEKDFAEQSAKMKEQFIANISHEMRTPMNAILGMSNLVLKTTLQEEQYNYVHSIKQSSEVLLGIINDILEVSSLQNGKISFEKESFDLFDLLNNMIEVMQYKMSEKQLDFGLQIDKENIPKILVGDKLRLNQILYNLVGNAIKFTDKGHVKVHVTVRERTDKQICLFVEVEDTGIGIPADKVNLVFDTFTRIKHKNRLYEGTGLGLSIAKNLVEQQGGVIGARSVLGEGSVFFFDITLGIAQSQAKIEKVNKYADLEIDADLDINLLLVEDNRMNQLVARKTLERQWKNIKITIADNGQIAVDLLRAGNFDLILMDIQMPVMDGYEATHYIRNNMPDHAHLPILAMTAQAEISKEDKFKEFGLDDYVLKPFDPEDLFYKIAKYSKK